MKMIILIAAIAATTISCGTLEVSAAAPTEEQCNTATNPGNISPWVSTEVNGNTLGVNVAGAYGLKSKHKEDVPIQSHRPRENKVAEGEFLRVATSRQCSRDRGKRKSMGMRIQEKPMGEGKLHPYTTSASTS